MRKKKIQTSESEFVTEGKTNQKSTVGPKKYQATDEKTNNNKNSNQSNLIQSWILTYSLIGVFTHSLFLAVLQKSLICLRN